MGLSNKLSCEAGSFSCCLNPHRLFQSEVLRFYFPVLELWVAWSVSLPSCSSQFAMSLLFPSCLSSPFLPVWVNVSSLTPWLSDFHTVRFSGSSGNFLFLNLLLFFFWLCQEAKYIYLYFHLGWKSDTKKSECFFKC